MRHEASVTSISWIPSEAMSGLMKLPMAMGVSHYDDPPPDHIDDLEAWRAQDRFRFANHLAAWIEVEDGKIVDHGYSGGGLIGATTLNLGLGSLTVPAIAYQDRQAAPIVKEGSVRFLQTAGGRTGAPMPRFASGRGLVRVTAPTAWTTLVLTINADGTSSFEVDGASPFPRHWIYDTNGDLAAKSGLIDYKTWAREHDEENSPWGDVDSPAIITAVETALERELSARIMQAGKKPTIREFEPGDTVVEQGSEGNELLLVLDGMLTVEVDGDAVAEVGPGSVLGELALLEGGSRTATLRAATHAKVVFAERGDIEESALEELAEGHRRESA
jgi:hypothetical protein